MRIPPSLRLHLPFLGALFDSLVAWHSRHFEGCVVSPRSIREKLDPNPSVPLRQPELPCDSHALRFWPGNLPELT
jgi:hypothetical protein